jgi:hypothetical protein
MADTPPIADAINDAVLELSLTGKTDALARLVPPDIAALLHGRKLESDHLQKKVQGRAAVVLVRILENPDEPQDVLERFVGSFFYGRNPPGPTVTKIVEGALNRKELVAAADLAFVVLKYRHQASPVVRHDLRAALMAARAKVAPKTLDVANAADDR